MGAALTQVGGQVANEGDRLFQIAKQEQEKTDTIKVEDAWNQYKNHALDLTTGQNGLLTTQGADAVNGNLLEKSTASLADARKRIALSLGNDEQRQRFEQRANITDLQTKQSVLSHLAQQRPKYAELVFNGAFDAAKRAIAVDPTSESEFLRQKDTLMLQADAHLDQNGIRDKGVRDSLREKLSDGLGVTRVDALLAANQPLLADALFRANPDLIKNPEIRIPMRAKVTERAVVMNATLKADEEITTGISDLIKREATAPPRATIEDGPVKPGQLFDTAVTSLLKREGGYVASDGNSGAPANFGINQKFNPDIDVKSLTRAGAIDLYRKRYWDKIDGDKLAPATSLVALDAAALQGPDVAKQLIASAGGDPVAMIAQRRTQLQELAKRDPTQARNLPGWMNRLTSLEAEIGQMPDGGRYQTVAMTDEAPIYNTNRLPNARDIAALKSKLLAAGEKHANALYGDRVDNPDRMAFLKHYESTVTTKLASEVAQVTAIQKDNLDNLTDAVMGLNPPAAGAGLTATGGRPAPGQMVMTSISQSTPAQMQQFQQLDAQGRRAVDTMLRVNRNTDERGDPALLNEFRNRIYLPADDPNRLNTWTALMNDPRVRAANLTPTQLNYLRVDFDRAQTDEGRSYLSMRKNAENMVRGTYQGNMVLTQAGTNKAVAELAQSLWTANADKVVAAYNKENKPIGPLFDPNNKDGLVTPNEIQRWATAATGMTTGLAAGAANVQNGKAQPIAQQPVFTAEQIAKLPEAPATLKTEAEAKAWLDALPAGVTAFRHAGDPPGVYRPVPGRNASTTLLGAQPTAVTAAESGTTLVEPDGTVVTKTAATTPEMTVDDFEVVTKPSTVRGQIEAIAKGRKRAAEIRKLGAQGPQYDITGPLVSLARGAVDAAGNAIDAVGAPGRALGRAIPTELEAIYSGFDAIKKAKRVSMADEDILDQVVKYGLLKPEDDKLARGLLAKIQAKK